MDVVPERSPFTRWTSEGYQIMEKMMRVKKKKFSSIPFITLKMKLEWSVFSFVIYIFFKLCYIFNCRYSNDSFPANLWPVIYSFLRERWQELWVLLQRQVSKRATHLSRASPSFSQDENWWSTILHRFSSRYRANRSYYWGKTSITKSSQLLIRIN